jgi:heterodisulfide reductase subunit B
MLAEPKRLRGARLAGELMEKNLSRLGARVVFWPFRNRCCGTFLAAAKPEAVTPMINRLMDAARRSGADCLVTACAMCQLNLEIRCTLADAIPTLHFSEVLALGLGGRWQPAWSQRHLVDPAPLLADRGLLPV